MKIKPVAILFIVLAFSAIWLLGQRSPTANGISSSRDFYGLPALPEEKSLGAGLSKAYAALDKPVWVDPAITGGPIFKPKSIQEPRSTPTPAPANDTLVKKKPQPAADKRTNRNLKEVEDAPVHGGAMPLDRDAAVRPVNPKQWGAVGNGVRDDHGPLQKMLSDIGAAEVAVKFPPGIYVINQDLTFPANIQVILPKGAQLSPGTVAESATLTNVDIKPKAGERLAFDGKQVNGTDTTFISGNNGGTKCWPGSYITNSTTGERKQVKHYDSDSLLYLVSNFRAPFSATSKWTRSNLHCTLKDAGKILEIGDFVYVAGQTYSVGKIIAPGQIGLVEHPAHPFNTAAWTRSVRVKILGSLEAGNYQVFTGPGVIKFGQGAVQSVRPEWWGARAGTEPALADANDKAIRKAMVSCKMAGSNLGAILQFNSGTYRLNQAIVMPSATYLVGANQAGCPGPGTTLWWVTHDKPEDCPISHIMDSFCYEQRPFGIVGINLSTANQSAPRTHIFGGYYNTKFLEVRDCAWTSYNSGRGAYALYLNVSADCKIIGNRLQAENVIYANGFDGMFIGNNVIPGQNYVKDSQFTADRHWVKGAGWTLVPAAAPAGRAVADHATGALSQTVHPITHKNGYRVQVWFSIYDYVRGSVQVSLGGNTNPARGGNGTYCEEFELTHTTDNDLKLIPSGGFTGKIGNVFILSGTGIDAVGGPVFSENIIYGDAGARSGVTIQGSYNPQFNCTTIENCGVGVDFRHASQEVTFSNCLVQVNKKHGFYAKNKDDGCLNLIITGTHIKNNSSNTRISPQPQWFHDTIEGGWGIYSRGWLNGIVTNNTFKNNLTGNINADHQHSGALWCENNYGVDIFNTTALYLDNSSDTPAAVSGKYFRTNAAQVRNIYRLTHAPCGKEAVISLGDSFTTIKEFGPPAAVATYSAHNQTWTDVRGQTAFPYFPDGAKLREGDAIYFGGVWGSEDERFGAVQVNVGTPWAGDSTLEWQYWNKDQNHWSKLQVTPADGNIFKNPGLQVVKFSAPANWGLSRLSGAPKSLGAHWWVRCVVKTLGKHSQGGANSNPGTGVNAPGLSYLRINGDLGPAAPGEVKSIHLRKDASRVWQEMSRMNR